MVRFFDSPFSLPSARTLQTWVEPAASAVTIAAVAYTACANGQGLALSAQRLVHSADVVDMIHFQSVFDDWADIIRNTAFFYWKRVAFFPRCIEEIQHIR
jgi:hypothetical protein